MWRDLERLTAKFGLAWRKPSRFPRSSALAARVACTFGGEPWCGDYIRRIFVANFGEDRDIAQEDTVAGVLIELGADPLASIAAALDPENRPRLRANTERAIDLGIFGAPNCVVNRELFWGEESLEDAIAWARRAPAMP